LLSRYLQHAPNEFRFVYTPFGKPSLGATLRFNVSHSHGLALFAFAATEIGVDLERIRPELAGQEIAQRFFAPEEAAALQELPPEQRFNAFFRCWTRKEAFIKAHGKGMSLPLNKFTVEFADSARLLSTAFDPAELDRWSLYGLEPGDEYAGAVAAEGKNHDLKLFDFTTPTPPSPPHS
jgi:4'-phosphopantetheinyl transferase